MTNRAVTVIHAPSAVDRFPVAAVDVNIGREHQYWTPRRFCPLDNRPRHVPVVRWIKLLPYRRSPRRRHFFHGGTGDCRKYLKMVPASRRFCRRHLALRMKGLHRAHRAHEDRRLPRRSEELHRSVQFTDVDQSSRPDLQMAVRLVVDADGHIVIDAGCQVAEMRRREHVCARLFQTPLHPAPAPRS